MGIAVNRNNRVMPHKDVTDFRDGWAVMCCFGNFRDGELCLPALSVNIDGQIKEGIKSAYRPRDVILFRATLMEPYVEVLTGTRIFLFFIRGAIVSMR